MLIGLLRATGAGRLVVALAGLALILPAAAVTVPQPGALPPATQAQRDAFVEAEALIAQGRLDEARVRVDGLGDYPLRGYLDIALLREGLASASAADVAAALTAYTDLPVARGLGQAWILERARRGSWAALHRDPGAADFAREPAARCRLAEAAWRSGDTTRAWEAVGAIWPAPASLPDECDPVLAAWRDAGQQDVDQTWRRLLAAMPADSQGLVRYLAKFLPAAQRERLGRWQSLRQRPAGLAAALPALARGDAIDRSILLDVFARLARSAPATARAAIDTAGLPAGTVLQLKEILGVQLARNRDAAAYGLLGQGHSGEALERRATLALRSGNWAQLVRSIEMMDADTAARDRWRYWRARARELAGGPFDGPGVRALARERGYYAFMAADRLDLDYAMAPVALTPTPARQAAIARRGAIARIAELRALRRADEARREWFHMLGDLDRSDREAAARVAADRDWHALAIFAASRARSWHDLDLRFPLAHREHVRRAAEDAGLAEARIYAIIRQESAFMDDVRSRAGALGPMQLMPATARSVARRLGLARPAPASLLEPPLNIRLGSRYLAGLQRRYDDHPVLSAAAYNAGPGNVARWRPRQGTVEAERWIESIPFDETRDYVRRVLAYQAIYRFRMGEGMARISSWMPPVPASGGT